jgi:hypothetical protein
MTQDETALYVAGTLEVRVNLFSSNTTSVLHPNRPMYRRPTFQRKKTIKLTFLAPKTLSYPWDRGQGLQPPSRPSLHAWLCIVSDCWDVQCHYFSRWSQTADCISF